jgi:hypothetical protein
LCPFARTIAVVSLTIARWPLRREQLRRCGLLPTPLGGTPLTAAQRSVQLTGDGGDLPGPRHPRVGAVEGILVALDFKPQAKVLAAERGIGCVQVDYDELRGVESDLLRLF